MRMSREIVNSLENAPVDNRHIQTPKEERAFQAQKSVQPAVIFVRLQLD